MREIKFRVWTGYEMQSVNYIANSKNFLETHPNHVLMQFTGLHDKNDKEIYEGDILELNGVQYGEAYYGEVIFKFGLFGMEYDDGIQLLGGNFYNPKSVEAIGNIFENPDLIGGNYKTEPVLN